MVVRRGCECSILPPRVNMGDLRFHCCKKTMVQSKGAKGKGEGGAEEIMRTAAIFSLM